MNLLDKEVLVIGLGISGLASIKLLNDYGAKISVADSKNEDELKEVLKSLDHIQFKKYLGNDNNINLEEFDLIIKSPGIPPKMELIRRARKLNIPIITDIELGFILSHTNNIISITGTNGKTTSTTLVGEIFKKSKFNTFVVGNIGVGILQEIKDIKEDDILIIESSSYQLEHTRLFKPKVSLILNISPDHLDWHENYDNYIKAKKKIFINQGRDDYTVLNYDDKIVRGFGNEVNSNIVWFSLEKKLNKGIYLDGKNIVIKDENYKKNIISIEKIKIPGRHNLENILGSIGIAYAMDIDPRIIKEAIEEFQGVEHRLEFVREKDGVSFYNDSKGTNAEASSKAIEAIKGPIILIAGGYDEKLDFDNLAKSFDNIKELILLGETREKIKDKAIKYGFKNYHLVYNMEEAVKLANKLSEKKDNILLSPACASWDMYKNFEERGNHFKSLVWDLEEE